MHDTALPRFVPLRNHGTALVFEQPETGLPVVLHWGDDLGDLSETDCAQLSAAVSRQTPPGTLDAAWQISILPQESDGWPGRPGVLVTRDGAPVFPRWSVTGLDVAASADRVVVTATDEEAGLELTAHYAIEAGGVITVRHELQNAAPGSLVVEWLEPTLPAPKTVDHLTEFSGRWTREKTPQTTALPRGTVTRQTRRGRSGHDSTTMLIASIDSPADRHGELWAVHLGWSADTTYRTDRGPEFVTLLGAGELLRPSEIVLAPGDGYSTPVVFFAWSGAGLDGLSDRFHGYMRARPQHPVRPRPLVLNTWEAVYFDHDQANLINLADVAASVGIERFVLDDGWFHSRRDDTTGLGDWVVDPAVWPDGLGPLAAHVHGLGMEFGLWFEPEMVNLDSDLARAHPDWLLHDPARIDFPAGLSWRTQFVLDLANPAAYAHVLGQMDALVTELGIDFIKWDHNRDLIEAVHAGRYGVHEQTLAAYRLFAELKSRHQELEIESCSSGGARSDLGVMAVADRMWASDSNDPVERQDIQRWTQLLLPPELVGGHVGPTVAHSSGRATDLSYRLATSLMGSAGFEWNIAECTADELATIAAFSALYKEVRHIIHTGTAVHGDLRDRALRLTGAVLPDRSAAVYTVASVATTEDSLPEHIRLHGLDPAARYTVRVRGEIGPSLHGWVTPAWLSAGEVTLPGSVLGTVGLQIPALWPAQAVVLHLTRA
ncbi:alpha-galactosidase [Cryobacterium arcticum]|uniref:alpha-galactosidase n=1 Tax=Cryobacterium arcticum TaxID=670052 RepID=A0A317ZV26_9MICO|nr:alpha-galactosidase [Cryobacterium arcticum]PXA68605.1 alpha-galactosidase [Cryobacterium arcticum]